MRSQQTVRVVYSEQCGIYRTRSDKLRGCRNLWNAVKLVSHPGSLLTWCGTSLCNKRARWKKLSPDLPSSSPA